MFRKLARESLQGPIATENGAQKGAHSGFWRRPNGQEASQPPCCRGVQRVARAINRGKLPRQHSDEVNELQQGILQDPRVLNHFRTVLE